MKNKAAVILLRVFGMLMIAAVIVTCCPAAIPRLAGYEIYNIVSGSMEPAIGVGSVVYVKPCRPHELKAGDIPAFYVNGDVIVHRIVRNDTNEKVLYTKGDANAAEDMNPVPYNMVIGRVERAIPHLGNVIALYTSRQGKVCVLGFFACRNASGMGVWPRVAGQKGTARKRAALAGSACQGRTHNAQNPQEKETGDNGVKNRVKYKKK